MHAQEKQPIEQAMLTASSESSWKPIVSSHRISKGNGMQVVTRSMNNQDTQSIYVFTNAVGDEPLPFYFTEDDAGDRTQGLVHAPQTFYQS